MFLYQNSGRVLNVKQGIIGNYHTAGLLTKIKFKVSYLHKQLN